MQAQTGVPEEGLLRSTYQQTVQALDERVKFISECHLSNETALLDRSALPDKIGPRSMSDIMPSLRGFTFTESPVQPTLRDLYTSQYDQLTPRCVLPPLSEGENSINEEDNFEPSCSWLGKTIIDSTRLTLDQIEPRKQEKRQPSPEWQNITELLIHNISKKIHLKAEVRSLQKFIHSNFSQFPWVRIKRIRELYYKGKASVLVRFSDEKSCSFAYYNLFKNENNRKEVLGSHSEVYRVVENRLRNTQEHSWMAVLVRKLPLQLKKADFLECLRKKEVTPIWVEELIEIENFKYTLCKIADLDEAFAFCSLFQLAPPFKETKVNLHPKSAKIWKQDTHSLI